MQPLSVSNFQWMSDEELSNVDPLKNEYGYVVIQKSDTICIMSIHLPQKVKW